MNKMLKIATKHILFIYLSKSGDFLSIKILVNCFSNKKCIKVGYLIAI